MLAATLLALLAATPSAAPAPTTGTISVETGATDPSLTRALPTFVDAVGSALTARGFTLLESAGHAGLVATMAVTRIDVGSGTAKVPLAKPAIGAGGSLGVGGNVSIPLPSTKTTIVPLQQTRLEIRIARRGDDGTVWQGAAITVRPAGTRQGADAKVASDLSEALFRAYPAAPADVVSVP